MLSLTRLHLLERRLEVEKKALGKNSHLDPLRWAEYLRIGRMVERVYSKCYPLFRREKALGHWVHTGNRVDHVPGGWCQVDFYRGRGPRKGCSALTRYWVERNGESERTSAEVHIPQSGDDSRRW